MIQPTDPDLIPPARTPAPVEEVGAKRVAPNFTVHLEQVFHGPLDLLLQLVRDSELEIHVVSLADVCDAYCQFVRSMDEVDVDEAADYLVVAATLLAVKSRSLLPQEEIGEEEDPFDPGEELIHQLLMYKELRQAAEELGAGFRRRARLLSAGGRWLGKQTENNGDEVEEEDWDLGDISIWDLLKVFQRLEKETGFMRPHKIMEIGRSLSWYVEEVWSRLEHGASLDLDDVFQAEEINRGDASYYLVALLEMAKQKAIDIHQEHAFGRIIVQRSAAAADIRLEDLDAGFDLNIEELEPELASLLEE